LLTRTDDYTATSGTSITLTDSTVAGDVISIFANELIPLSDAISKGQFTGKGALVTASATSTPAVLAVGSNGDSLVADSAATTGLRWQGNYAAGKNKVINGDFGVWQRGTSFTNPATGSYTADRFLVDITGTPTTYTVSRQLFTPGTAPVAGYESPFFFRSAQTTLGTLTNVDISQRVEDVRTFAGQTVTLSFWAKADSTRNVGVYVAQIFGSGGSSTNFPLDQTGSPISLTTSWVRYSYTFTMTSVSGKTIGSNSYVQITFRQAAASGYNLDIWGLQLEASNTATAFQTATGTIQGELAACQRYYYLHTSGNALFIGTGGYYTATNYQAGVFFPVQMRTTPTLSAASGASYYQIVTNNTTDQVDSLTIERASTNACAVYNNSQASGTIGHYGYIHTNNASSTVAFSAEL
jgi:hypothetical protein